MLESALAALQSLADPGLLLMLVIGVAAGLVMGLIPGLGGTGAVAILLPVTKVRAVERPMEIWSVLRTSVRVSIQSWHPFFMIRGISCISYHCRTGRGRSARLWVRRAAPA